MGGCQCLVLVLGLRMLALARRDAITLVPCKQTVGLLGDVVDEDVGVNGSGGGEDSLW
jgi:hypothetical protein